MQDHGWERRLNAWISLIRTHGLLTERFERDMQARVGLNLPRFDVLAQLDRHGGRLRYRDLVDAVMLSRGGLSRLVERMARDGLVGREDVPGDDRGVMATLTPKGAELLRQAREIHHANVRRHFADQIDDAEAEALIDILGRVRRALPEGAATEAMIRWGPAEEAPNAEAPLRPPAAPAPPSPRTAPTGRGGGGGRGPRRRG